MKEELKKLIDEMENPDAIRLLYVAALELKKH